MFHAINIADKPPPQKTSWLLQQYRSSPLPSYRQRVYVFWQKVNGYHFGVLCCAVTSAVILLINIVATAWASAKFGVSGGIGTLQEGNCTAISKLGFWLHLLINALSTLLLGASNYSMQCLASPTRADIDKAHRRGVWLDIGVPSVKNLRRVASSRIAIWWLLAVSTIPLHLFWNSVVFSSLYAREYDVFVVPDDFLGGNCSELSYPDWSETTVQRYAGMCLNATSLQKLENEACIEAYSTPFNSARGSVLLIAPSITRYWKGYEERYPTFDVKVYPNFRDGSNQSSAVDWPCNNTYPTTLTDECDIYGAVHTMFSSWILQWEIQYCLSQRVREHCKLQLSITMMVIVIICNFIKLCCTSWIVWKQDTEPLVTLGDAIASFLSRPDATTIKTCLADKDQFQGPELVKRLVDGKVRELRKRRGADLQEACSTWKARPQFWISEHRNWFSTASKCRWVVCTCLCALILVVVGTFLAVGLNISPSTQRSMSYLYSLGFGNVSRQSMILPSRWNFRGSGGLLITVLISNSPQLILSFTYLTYNSLFTCMLLGHEWSGYAEKRKTLRVTTAKGQQRSTYWLQLPYRYGIPLLVGSGVLHWLVSQSIFLARVTVVNEDGIEDPAESVSTCGYSLIALIFVLIIGSFITLVGLAHGFWRYNGKIPIAGSCSAAISAACHPPQGDTDAASKPIMWGVVDGLPGVEMNGRSMIGHCSFTSFEVRTPVEGHVYA